MRAALYTSVLLLVFLLGWVSSTLYVNFAVFSAGEAPLSFLSLFNGVAPDRQSPADHVPQDAVHVYDDRVVLNLKGATWAQYADTKSMDPVFDSTANGIEIKPVEPTDIHAGDIISYRSGLGNGLVVHRVITIGHDAQGWYAVAKGDNNPTADPEKVRFSDINGVLAALIY